VRVRVGDRPGDVGEVIALHARLYAGEYGLDATFEGYVASGLGEWLTGPRTAPGRLWVAEDDGRVVGAVGLTGISPQLGQLRWFLVDAAARGRGVGRELLDGALAFARSSGYERVMLETFSELEGAAHLYRAAGFERTETWVTPMWGRELARERYELAL
jgi:ribosomal protein S18 acetylase RimI-like enzyme